MLKSLKKLLVESFTCRACSSIAEKIIGSGIPIFMLHRMRHEKDVLPFTSATSDQHLHRCLAYLKNNRYQFLSIRQLTQALANHEMLPERCAVFTMDDGFEDQATIAGPIFQLFDCPTTIFLITGMLDGETWPWDDKIAYMINTTKVLAFNISIGETTYQFSILSNQSRRNIRRKIQDAVKAQSFEKLDATLEALSEATQVKIPEAPPPQYKPLTWDLARHYESLGLEFAAHSVSHPILSRLNSDGMRDEIQNSWRRVNVEISNPSPVFCYPTGRYCDFGAREIKLLRESGFTGAVSTIAAQVRTDRVNQHYLYSLPRFPLPDSFTEFKLYCSWFEYVRERNLRYWPR